MVKIYKLFLILFFSIILFGENKCPHCGHMNELQDNICIQCVKVIDPSKKNEKKEHYKYEHKEVIKKDEDKVPIKSSCSYKREEDQVNEDKDKKTYDDYKCEYWNIYYEIKRLRKEIFRLKKMKKQTPENKILVQDKLKELKINRKRFKEIRKQGWDFKD